MSSNLLKAKIINRIFFRQGPGDHYQEKFTLYAAGQHITVVKRQQDKKGKWWIQVEGIIHDTGSNRNYDVAGLWTRANYLDKDSYNYYKIPTR